MVKYLARFQRFNQLSGGLIVYSLMLCHAVQLHSLFYYAEGNHININILAWT